MWQLRQKPDGTIYLTYDRYRRYSHSFRGIWEFIGKQDSAYTARAVRMNQSAGLICANDDEGGVRVLVLTE